ncbi:hypothetical protein Vi05172_g3967 [Venturia inaequalis]|nr:hypothetical protein Vi05172_g3967 [Venturia inaequalis]
MAKVLMDVGAVKPLPRCLPKPQQASNQALFIDRIQIPPETQ